MSDGAPRPLRRDGAGLPGLPIDAMSAPPPADNPADKGIATAPPAKPPVGRKPRNLRLILIGALALVVVVGAALWWVTLRPRPVSYVTAPVSRGDVATTITASGTINPVVTVAVGTYVSGTIVALSCDYNTRVRKGQLCAKIDPAPYQVVVDQDQAALATAQAQTVKDRANVVYTRIAHQRQVTLLAQDSTSRDSVDLALNAYAQAVALVALDEASGQQKQAILKAAQINLNYTNIVSPVDGTVVSRNVNAGQTVAASLQTPTLFLIATDLTKMQVDTNVSESDIPGAVNGAAASFTVDAFPSRTFQGAVTQVRQAPISVQNVITYDAVITVENPDLLLKPGMTATARIVEAARRGVLRVPSRALRFTPAGTPSTASVAKAVGGQVVWILREGKLIRVPVNVGLNDDTFAEITAGDLQEGDQVVTALAAPAGAKAKAAATPSLHV